ncbi:hypothetical protein PVT67_05330 [Gallaecimonas kandeliae]|uniref:hypothetical protein n=1 Tax=Gallaecimonas kandeliae TaxID=3029055 RepID=UPI0026495FB2|nr:hypothetical protein [Gallaecimonas kandeliae]WKE66668.1 hypothetical protein PVT67_05330 [Gallaecimonas kandeliae]
MRNFILIALALFSAAVAAEGIASEGKARATLAWSHDCDGNSCWLEKIVDFQGKGGMSKGGVAVSYDRAKHQPEFIAVIVPTGVPQDSEVEIRFIDSVKRQGQWHLVPIGDDFLGLPISGCNKASCQARVHAQIPDGPDLFEELKKRSLLWIMFEREGEDEPERIMVPLSGLDNELRAIQ